MTGADWPEIDWDESTEEERERMWWIETVWMPWQYPNYYKNSTL